MQWTPLCLLIAALRSVTPAVAQQLPQQQPQQQQQHHQSASLVYDPRLRHFRTPDTVPRPDFRVQNYEYYHRAAAPSYYLPQRAAPPELQHYRNEGNFYRTIASAPVAAALAQPRAPPAVAAPPASSQSQPRRSPPALFDHSVLHEPPPAAALAKKHNPATAEPSPELAAERWPGSATAPIPAAGHDDVTRRQFHDIYMRYAEPARRLAYGHVESRPELLAKRFESLNVPANRYRGEVVWADRTGGYGAHNWDMALGKL